jgi:hypothetical protein
MQCHCVTVNTDRLKFSLARAWSRSTSPGPLSQCPQDSCFKVTDPERKSDLEVELHLNHKTVGGLTLYLVCRTGPVVGAVTGRCSGRRTQARRS